MSGLLLPIVAAFFVFLTAVIAVSVWAAMRAMRGSDVQQFADRMLLDPSVAEYGTPSVTILTDARDAGGSKGLTLARLQERLADFLAGAHLTWTPRKLVLLAGIAAGIGALFGLRASRLIPGALAIPAMAALTASAPFFYVAHRRQKRLAAFEAMLPDALDFLARSIRAGNALPISLEMLAADADEPVRSEFLRVSNELRLGAPFPNALRKLVDRIPLIDLRMFVSALLLQRDTGGNLTELLNRLAGTIRERFRIRGQVKAAAAQAEFTAQILALMPIALGGAILLLSPDYLSAMTESPMGQKLLMAAGVAQVCGFFVMRRLVRIKV